MNKIPLYAYKYFVVLFFFRRYARARVYEREKRREQTLQMQQQRIAEVFRQKEGNGINIWRSQDEREEVKLRGWKEWKNVFGRLVIICILELYSR